MFCDFQTTTHGKWILAGEHAVLRGHPALVFPMLEKQLSLQYKPRNKTLQAQFTGEHGDSLNSLFWRVLDEALCQHNKTRRDMYGHFYINSNIPVGVGMGASAALCVAMSRWCAAQSFINEAGIHDFARTLENLFHGQSSGLDIAGVAATTGIYFQQGVMRQLTQTWQPNWRLSSCGKIGKTLECINIVNELRQENPSQAETLDLQMHDCVIKACHALEDETDIHIAEQTLIQSINNAGECFKHWGLISLDLQQHMEALRRAGAMAVKPTGSGGGGYVLSLFSHVNA